MLWLEYENIWKNKSLMQISVYSKLEERLKALPSNMKHLIGFMDEAASIEKDKGIEKHASGCLLVAVDN